MKTKTVFCAREQKDTEHVVTIDANGEYLLSCPCGAFIKLPSGIDGETAEALLNTHRVANTGQRSVAQIEAENQVKLAELGVTDESEVPVSS